MRMFGIYQRARAVVVWVGAEANASEKVVFHLRVARYHILHVDIAYIRRLIPAIHRIESFR